MAQWSGYLSPGRLRVVCLLLLVSLGLLDDVLHISHVSSGQFAILLVTGLPKPISLAPLDDLVDQSFKSFKQLRLLSKTGYEVRVERRSGQLIRPVSVVVRLKYVSKTILVLNEG